MASFHLEEGVQAENSPEKLSPESGKLKEMKVKVEEVSEELLQASQNSTLGFSTDQVVCLCEALMKGDNVDLLDRFLFTILPLYDLLRDNETLLKAQALVAFHQEEFTKLYAILESRDFHPSNHGFLQDLYLRARYKEAERSRGRSLGAVDKCRLRKKFPLPKTIWDGEKTRNDLTEYHSCSRQDQELDSPEPFRQRLTTIRLAVLPHGRETLFLPRVGSSMKKIVVPLAMSERAFIQKIRAEFPGLQGDFHLCSVNRRRKILPLELTSVCPSAIKACPLLRRSAVYIRPKEIKEVEVGKVMDGDEMEGENWLEEEEEEQDEEAGRSGRVRQRLTTIRLAVLPNGRETLFIPRVGLSIKKIVVPLAMSERAFIQKIRAEFPGLQGDFHLCSVNRRRKILPLELTSVCPSAIKACPLLRRSAVYIRPKEIGEEKVGNVHKVGDEIGREGEYQDMEELSEFEEEEELEKETEQNRLEEEDMCTDQSYEEAVERESAGLPKWDALPSKQNKEYQHSPILDKEMERRRRQFVERELRRVEVINTRRKIMKSILEPYSGIAVQFKYPDGGLKSRRFRPSQPFQHIVAFAGTEEMASEIFTLQKAMSPVTLLSTQEGSLADNGITAPCTLYILWMSGDAVEDIKANSSTADDQTHASPPSTVPTFSSSPPPAHSPSNIASTLSSPDRETTEEPYDIVSTLKTLKSRVHHVAPTANQINVLRNEELDCALRAFRRPAFDPESKLDIVFIDEDGLGEGATDDGGPTREFCRLLMGQIQGHQIFEGPLEARTLALDSVALQNNIYRIVGQMLAVCLIQGDVSPNFFSKRLFSQVLGLPSDPATIEDVVDHGLKTKLEKISSAETLDNAQQAVNEAADDLAGMGALWHLQSLEQRKKLMETVLQSYCEGRVQAALQQFKEGLSTLGVLEEAISHPQAFEKIFLQDPTSLKASDIVRLFQASCRSLPGSNRRRLEARTIAFWKDWLLEVEGGLTHPITLEHVLTFATGLQRIPVMGFAMQPDLAFLHPEDGLAKFPKANTCSLVLHLPVGQTYSEFKSNMELGIGSAHQCEEC